MTVVDLSRIDRTIEIDAPLERVWQALTNATELGAWFQVKVEGEVAANTEVWMTSTHKGFEGQRFRVKFTEFTPPRRLSWQWHPGQVDSGVDYAREPRTTVTFTLESSGRGTRVNLSETGFDLIGLERREKVYKDNNQGWPEVLQWLRTYVEKTH